MKKFSFNSCLNNTQFPKLVCIKNVFIGCLLFLSLATKAQVTVTGGTAAIAGSPYTTLTAAINAINSGGALTAPVVVNVPAGYTETLTGRITLTMTGTISNTIVIQKNGSGANPILTSYVGTVSTPSNAADGMFALAGCDYVTIDGIDLQESAANTTTTTVMEFGYGLFKASATDGCQNNTIKNCTITLNRIQNGSWTAPGHNGSVGITMNNGLNTAAGALTPTAASGANSFNKFYANTIQNCNAGIVLAGFAAASPFNFVDASNDIGGSSLATGNIIQNFGGGAATNPATGIFATSQYTLNCSFNTINNNTGTGVNHATTLRGIFLNSSSTSANGNCNNNTVTVKGGGTTSLVVGIDVEFGSTALSNTINVNNNTVQNCTYATATTGVLQAILTSTSAATVNVSGNTITNNSMTGTGQFDGITIQSTPTTVVANSNIITNNTKSGTGTMNCLFTTSSAGNVTMSSNTITGNVINGGAATSTLNCLKNALSIYNVTGNTIGSNGITNMIGTGTGEVNGIVEISSAINETTTNNNIGPLTIGGTSTSTAHLIRGIVTSSGATSSKTQTGNTISGLAYTGTAGSATVSGIQSTAGNIITLSKNKIYDLSSTGIGAICNGINILSGTTYNISNNIIGDLRTPAATGLNAINGINASATSTYNLFYNTIYLNASSTSVTTFGTSCVTFNSTATAFNNRNNIFVNASSPALDGSNTATNGIAACIRRSAGTIATVPTNYGVTSNNNSYWCNPTAGTNNHMSYVEGTSTIANAFNTVSSLKSFMLNRDQSSVQENPTFISTIGTNAQFLHVNSSIASQLESGAVNINTFTADIDGHIRFGNTGYPGGSAGFPTGGSAPDIGADEFAGIFLDLSSPLMSYTVLTNTCSFANRTISVTITDNTGIPLSGTLIPNIYFRKNGGTWFSASGTNTSGTSTNSVWSFTINSTTLGGVNLADNIEYYFVAQDIAATNNVGANPSLGFVGSNVNTVTTAPTFPNSYTITAIPTFATVTPTGVSCNGNINGQLVVTSSASSPVFSINPAVTQLPAGTFTGMAPTIYTVTVTDAGGCTNTTAVTITQPAVLAANASAVAICNGGVASVTANPTGGTAGYTYQWQSGYTVATPIAISPSKDNTIYQGNQSNSNALGTQFLAGQSNSNFHRGLIAFNIGANIPAGSIITSASLSLHCSGTAGAAGAQNVSLYKLLQDWGEGTSVAVGTTGIGNLVPATTNDATWLTSFFPSTNWTTAGGTFTPTASATSSVNAIGDYSWTSVSLKNDVQNWLNTPSANFGWIVRGVETAIHQAKRYSSREEPVVANRPKLTVGYSIPTTIGTTATLNNFGVGTYTVVVTDANGCTVSSTVTVITATPPTTNTSATSILCNGGVSTLSSTTTGGLAPYTYQWVKGTNTVATSANATNMTAGTYTLTVTDANGCTATSSLTVNAPTLINVSTSATAIACNGGTTNLSSTVTGGTGSYTYQWKKGITTVSTSASANNQTAGTYTLTVTDANGCTATSSLSVNSPAIIAATISATTIACNGGTTNLSSTVTGGTGSYSYQWVKGTNIISTSASANNMTAGTYTLTVTDVNGCTAFSSLTVNEPTSLSISTTASSIACTGGTTTLNATVSGGTGSYTYQWASGNITNSISLSPAKDNTIYQSNTSNSNGAGNILIAGNNGNGFINRALLSFNTSAIPTNAIILNSSLNINCTGGSGAAGAQNQSIYKLLQDWGEGTSNAGSGAGAGAAATPGDATWLKSFFPTSNWSVAGGSYNAVASATTSVNAAGLYTWTNTNLNADVQSWVNNPSTNYGWILRGPESGPFQAKKYSSREDADSLNWPLLMIDYTVSNIVGTTASVSNITAGTYTLTVTDANGCSNTSVITVSEPAPLVVNANASPSNAVCNGDSITLTGSGATTYIWTNGVMDGIAFTPSATTTYTVTGTDANGCSNTSSIEITVNNCNAILNLKYFIEGYYTATNTMTTKLYNSGEELNPLSTNVDTVTVELHDANSPYALAESYIGLLQTNGTMQCTFSVSVIGNSYYIVVRHNNTIDTWSANPLLMSSNNTYDFSSSSSQAYGSNQIDLLSEGIWSVFSGDLNADGAIDASDFLLLDADIQAFSSGYLVSDLNGDGAVDASDFLILDSSIQNFISVVTP